MVRGFCFVDQTNCHIVGIIPEVGNEEDMHDLLQCEFREGCTELTYFGGILETRARFVLPSFEEFVRSFNSGATGKTKTGGAVFFISTL